MSTKQSQKKYSSETGYDFDTFVTRTIWWRASVSIVLSLLAITLIFINQTVSNYGEATQKQLEILQEKTNLLQQKIDTYDINHPSATKASIVCEAAQPSDDGYVDPVSKDQRMRIGHIIEMIESLQAAKNFK